MIKFFRKIRQNLLMENKFSKYLVYAIGEIILVVVGILIALQVNNWNEERKLNTLEIATLNEIKISSSGEAVKKAKSIIEGNQSKGLETVAMQIALILDILDIENDLKKGMHIGIETFQNKNVQKLLDVWSKKTMTNIS